MNPCKELQRLSMELFPLSNVMIKKEIRGGICMFEEINARLVAIQSEWRKKEKYQVQLKDYEKDLEVIKGTIYELRKQFESEKKDVDRLEHISLANLLATLAGTKEEKLSKEKQEMIIAQHRLAEAEKAMKQIDDSIDGIRIKLQNLAHIEDEYQQLLEQKEQMIKMSSSPYAENVFQLSEQEGAIKAFMIELDEAITSGERVKHVLGDAIRHLEKAEGWGTWDMLGGGTISGIAKHQNIDQAERYLRQAQTNLRHFQKELLDVQEVANLEVNISGMLKFADFFFDGFIADFMVQGKIKRSLENVRDQYSKVNDILYKLKAQSEEKQRELVKVHGEKQEIVEKL